MPKITSPTMIVASPINWPHGVPVKGGLIDVPDRPGTGIDLIADAARPYLSEDDADFFD